ncbi:MAG: toast rack family protein [Bryobacteraceae bacterium]|nr:toast rack family protein [Bryobacteraceae bacterium]
MSGKAACWSILAISGALVLAGCNVPPQGSAGEERLEKVVIEKARAQGAERITAEIHIAAGELAVLGGAREFLEATFAYNAPALKPQVRFEDSGFRRRLTIAQGTASLGLGKMRNQWEIRFGSDVPLDLAIRCGAGNNRLDFREIPLRSLEMNLGVGEVEADLRPKLDHDVEARINGGIGRAEILVPAEGVEATAQGGIGNIQVIGLDKDGGGWRSASPGKAKGRLKLEVKGGIGEIIIRAE